MMKLLKNDTINIKAANKLDKNKMANKIIIGELYSNKEAEYTDEYQKIIDSMQEGR